MNLLPAKAKWAITLSVIGATITFLLIATLRFTGSDQVFFALHDFSYLALTAGRRLFELFEPERERPSQAFTLLFDLFVIVFTGVQWFIVGRVIDLVRGFKRKTANG